MAPSSSRPARGRRQFLKQSLGVAAAAATTPAAALAGAATPVAEPAHPVAQAPAAEMRTRVAYPRVFTGAQLAQIAFPLGGIGTGCVSLGGRGQLRDWEIFNRPDQGLSPGYVFPSIRVQHGSTAPFVSVLEARLRPPYQGAFGLGSNSAPGLQRLESARFTGEFPLAHVAFRDRRLPVQVSLDAFSPFIPHDADASGLPAAVLRYRVTNPGTAPAVVSIAYSLENPLLTFRVPSYKKDPRVNEPRTAPGIEGLLLLNPAIADDNALAGSLGLWVLGSGDGRVSMLRGWPRARWWTSALHFWDDFSDDGALGPESAGARTGWCSVSAAHDRAWRLRGFHLRYQLAHSESHAGSLRLGRGAWRGWCPHWQLLLHALRRRLGGRALPRRPSRQSRAPHARLRRRNPSAARFPRRRRTAPPPTCPPSSRKRASAPRTASSTASKAAAKPAAAATAIARTSGTTRRPRHTSFQASLNRCAAPPSATRWTTMAACDSGSHCRMAASASRPPRPTARWARSSRSIWIGACRATTRSSRSSGLE